MAAARLVPKFIYVSRMSRRLASGMKPPSAAVTAGEEGRRSGAPYQGFPLAYPDFLPSPVQNRRNPLFMELVHADMLQRRLMFDIPEFYVGSVLALTMSDPNLSDRKNRFVGICVSRHKEGLFHQITLRNVIDGLGVEVMYELYTPTILKIEVLRLERRLDDDLSYLIDALPEYSTFDFDMEPVPHPIGKPVPVNPLKVKLRSPPWTRRWDIYEYKGIEDSWTKQTPHYKRKLIHTSKLNYTQKYDIVQHYRDASQEFEHDVATQHRMLQFETGNERKLNADADGGRKRKILRLMESAE